ncbi:MAG: protein translocase subunit SecF [Acidobacteria bacterium]|nr:protein translocase subunit SecF [Acidobacteriota bacterium]
MQILRDTKIDFLRWRWHAMVLSVAIILTGVGLVATRGGLPLGIDFSGGTIVVMRFAAPVSEQQVRDAVAAIPGEKVVQQYGEAGDNEILVRLPQLVVEEADFDLEQGANQVLAAVRAANLGEFEVLSTEVVGPVIGKDLQRKGIFATIASLFGITVYIALRFRFSFAVGALAATFHDVLVTLTFITLFNYELSLNVVAAILTITGYSVNDTIVIFDRVRENLRLTRREPLDKVINHSVNQTLARTIITSGTTGLAVLALFLFGGEVLEGFAFTMLVGIIAGTYSTVFIAAAVAVVLSKRQGPGAKAAAEPPAPGAPAAKTGRRPSRRARAS